MADNKDPTQQPQAKSPGASDTAKAAETTDRAAQVAQRTRDETAERARRSREVRGDLAQQQGEVMDNSRPTPTQEENDRAKLGLPVDEKEESKGPTMPGLEEQQNRVAEAAAGGPGYRTRDSTARRR